MDGLFVVTGVVVVIVISVNIGVKKWVSSMRRRRIMSGAVVPLGKLGWPLIGETIEFLACAYSDCPESFMNKRRRLYGKVFKSHIFGRATIISTDPEVSKLILQSDSNTFVPSYPKSVTELMGKSSILLINAPLHKKIHGLVAAFIKSPLLKAQITKDMHRYLHKSMQAWTPNRPIYIQDEAKNISFQVLVKALISVEAGEEMEMLKKEFEEFISGLMSLPINLPGTSLYRSLQAKKKMIKMVERIIQSKRKVKVKVEVEGKKKKMVDVVDVLMNGDDEELSESLIAENMIDMMIPGEDSVPLLITLAVKFLSTSPLALQHLREENIEMKRRKGEEGMIWSDYVCLEFTQNVITETLRMGNIITGVMRKAVRDVEIKGYLIPKGWSTFAYFRSLHLDETLYQSPYNFHPWRWQLSNNNNTINTTSFTPFGGGQRLCPGMDLARLQASIFLHHLVTQFTWQAEQDTVINFPTVRMKRKMPIWVKTTRRTSLS